MRFKVSEEFRSIEDTIDHEMKHNRGKQAKKTAVRQANKRYNPEDIEDIPDSAIQKTGMMFFKDHEDWDGNKYEYNDTYTGLVNYTNDADTLADYAVHCGTGKHDDPDAPIVGYRSYYDRYTGDPQWYHVYNRITGQYIIFTLDNKRKSGYLIRTYHLRNDDQYTSYYRHGAQEFRISGVPGGIKYNRAQFVDEIPKNPLHVSKTNFWKKIEQRLIDGKYYPNGEYEAIKEQTKTAAEESTIKEIELMISELKKYSGEELQQKFESIQDVIAKNKDEIPDLAKRISNMGVLKNTIRNYFTSNKNKKNKKK